MTSYAALSPRRRTECGSDWTKARDTLVDDARFLASTRGPRCTEVDRAQYASAAEQIAGWATPGVPLHLTFFDAWESPRRFQIIAQEEFVL